MEGGYVGSGRFDSTLSRVAKVWADLLLGHTFPLVQKFTLDHRRAEITSPGTMGWYH